ncbi:MAG: 2-amino-4-hydroxy-6-hydroxymethyldihydropteridine diphosphokinase [Muribaculaceae bacterium]|nr:2-amino-4-hydroxy-6-hydroxymethyldihydropteridine diphosphokinase [Muribaculaceae bacterium]
MHTVFINIGSNMGQRRLVLSRAMRAVGEAFDAYEISHVVESEPWGFDSDRKFLNLGMMFASELEPRQILERLLEIERSISTTPHRNADGSYTDRELDIDLVAVDELTVNEPGLILPHPRLAERDFFLVPMEELAPGWHHPVTGLTPTQMLHNLENSKIK